MTNYIDDKIFESDNSSIVNWDYRDHFKLVSFFYKKISRAQNTGKQILTPKQNWTNTKQQS